MPTRLSNTVKVFSLNREEIVNKKLNALAKGLIGTNKNVLKVLLFGSLASNSYSPFSDIDLLIIVAEDNRRRMDRIPEFLLYFLDAGHPVDVVVYTAKEIEWERTNPFLKKVLNQGMILAER